MRACDSAASYTVEPSSAQGQEMMIYDSNDCWRLRQELDKSRSSQRCKLSIFNALGVLQNSCEHLTHEEVELTNGERFEVQSFTTRTRKTTQPPRANAPSPALIRHESFTSRSVATETVQMVDASMNTSVAKQVTIQEDQNTCHLLPKPISYSRQSYYDNVPINWENYATQDDRSDESEAEQLEVRPRRPGNELPPPVPKHRTPHEPLTDSVVSSMAESASEQIKQTASQILPDKKIIEKVQKPKRKFSSLIRKCKE